MLSCPRCKRKTSSDDNYCAYCGIPLKSDILKMVQKSYAAKRRQSVHSALSVLIKEGCIREDKLASLMKRLESVFGARIQKGHQQK